MISLEVKIIFINKKGFWSKFHLERSERLKLHRNKRLKGSSSIFNVERSEMAKGSSRAFSHSYQGLAFGRPFGPPGATGKLRRESGRNPKILLKVEHLPLNRFDP